MQRISIGQVLTSVPHVTVAQWRASSWLVRWLISARASVLVMSFASAAVGILLAVRQPHFDAIAAFAATVGLLLAHAANNQLNDLTDSVRGIDDGNYFRNRYGAHVLQDQLLTTRGLWGYIGVTAGVALAIGLWLVSRVGPTILLPLVAGSLFLLFYTWPLKQWGLGELAVLLVWGPLMVGGAYLAASGAWSWDAALIGTVYALGPTAVIFGKHIDKLEFDRTKRIATLPVRLGATQSRRWVRGMVALSYLGTFALIALGSLPWPVLLVALALPKAYRLDQVYREPAPATCPSLFPPSAWPLWYVAFAFDHTRSFSLLFVAGLCVGRALA